MIIHDFEYVPKEEWEPIRDELFEIIHRFQNEVRDNYIDKKNTNADDNKKSRSIFAETIHQVCQQNGYYR